VCDGLPLSSAKYKALFALIGNLYGSGVDRHGSPAPGCDFNLPDYRGVFLRGFDVGSDGAPSGLDPGRTFGKQQPYATAVGSMTARETHHAHGEFTGCDGSEQSHYQGGGHGLCATRNASPNSGSATIELTSSDTETRPVNVSANWIIKAK
jgi:microcystin-dependent protein